MTVHSFKPGSTERVTFMTDYTDPGLTSFCQQLVTAYLRIGYATDKVRAPHLSSSYTAHTRDYLSAATAAPTMRAGTNTATRA